MTPGFWRFAAVPLAALALGAWLTWPREAGLGDCLADWQFNDMTDETAVDVVAVGDARVALLCLADGEAFSFTGVLLAPGTESIALGDLSAAREADLDLPYSDAEVGALIDEAIAVRFGCRVMAEGAVPSRAAALPRIGRYGIARDDLICDLR